MSLKPSEILSAAADLIEQKGWTQGVYGRRNGRQVAIEHLATADCYCAAGAVYCLTNGRSISAVEDRLASIARRGGYLHIANWNDDPDRKPEQVTAALRQAAEKARKAG